MSKIKLLCHPDDPTSFTMSYTQSLLSKYFDIVLWQPNTDYTLDHVVCVNSFKIGCPSRPNWHRQYLYSGYKIVVDNTWEIKSFADEHFSDPLDGCLLLQSQNWFWYHESLLNTTVQGTYRDYRPNKTYKQLALMPIGLDRAHRKELVVSLSQILDQIIWSCTLHGRRLPNDQPGSIVESTRYFNPDWYDDTYFSIIAETVVEIPNDNTIFITEKTFKPIAYYHPFAVLAQPGHLQYVRNLGFETFGNLFDESYDNIDNWMLRLKALVKTIKDFDPEPYDITTLQKLEHNYNRFYDQTLVESRFVSEIIHPILEYAESK